ncbi:hypothetical protein N9562_00400 [Flavobacteriaceae bacterium]|nr:hypothetical protein [Flavobacteriaceae bacterium]
MNRYRQYDLIEQIMLIEAGHNLNDTREFDRLRQRKLKLESKIIGAKSEEELEIYETELFQVISILNRTRL